jgi:hypothetical protein
MKGRVYLGPRGAIDWGVTLARAGETPVGTPQPLGGYDPRSLHPRVKGF